MFIQEGGCPARQYPGEQNSMAQQTIDLNGTTETISGNVNGESLYVIEQGTLDVTGTVNGSTIQDFYNNVTIGGMDNGSTLSLLAGTVDVVGTANGGEIAVTDGVGIVGGDLNGVLVTLDTSHFIDLTGFANGDTFDFYGSVDSTGTHASTIELSQGTTVNLFENLNTGDHIELKTPFNSASISNDLHTITLYENGSAVSSIDVTFAPGAPTDFFIGVDKTTGLSFLQVIPCFAAGTRIMTARGEVPVEELREGDLAVTLSGKGSPLKPVRWIGERRVDVASHPHPNLVRPVRIKAGAFADGMPLRDLVVSPDHALSVDGVLIQAGKLVNGVSIVQDLATSAVHYFHVELESHDVLLADGMPAESYLDTGNRSQFANAARLVVLHPDFRPKQIQTDACQPFVEEGPVLAGVRTRLIERLQAQSYAVSHDPNLILVVNGRMLRPSLVEGQIYRFVLPDVIDEVRLVSRSGIPSGTSAGETDCRRLGVCVGGLTLLHGEARTPIALDNPALEGFHALESNGAESWRWTDGDAGLPVSTIGAGAVLEVRLLWPGTYWVAPERAESARAIA
jgi:hypothetical protein